MMALEMDKEMVRRLLPARTPQMHKGDFGHLFVLAGSCGFTGAAKLVCNAAYRSGVGLVTLGIPSTLAGAMTASLVETMLLPLPATETETFASGALEPALAFAANKDAVVLGPGLSRHPETAAFVHGLVRRCPVPLLIDADGLNALSVRMEALDEKGVPCVLTPHPGEMARLLKTTVRAVQEDREGAAAMLAGKHDCVVVLKGYRTVVACPVRGIHVNTTGNSGLGTGGAGDVLSGIIGSLMAQGMDGFDAACAGVYVHGLAGDIAAELLTPRAMMASDVIDALPDAWKQLEETTHDLP